MDGSQTTSGRFTCSDPALGAGRKTRTADPPGNRWSGPETADSAGYPAGPWSAEGRMDNASSRAAPGESPALAANQVVIGAAVRSEA